MPSIFSAQRAFLFASSNLVMIAKAKRPSLALPGPVPTADCKEAGVVRTARADSRRSHA